MMYLYRRYSSECDTNRLQPNKQVCDSVFGYYVCWERGTARIHSLHAGRAAIDKYLNTPSPQQQTCSSGVWRPDGTDGQTDGRTDAWHMHTPCSACFADNANNIRVHDALCIQFVIKHIGADSTGATGNFAPVLTQEPGQTLRFSPVPFMAVFLFFKWTLQLYLLNLTKGAKFAGSVGHPMTKMLSALGGFAPWPGALPLGPAGGSAPRPPS